MAPVPETALPTESKFDATGNTFDGAAPTSVDAYRSRGIRSTHSALDLVPIVLRILLTVFTLIAFAIIASDSFSLDLIDVNGVFFTSNVKFSDFFFFSYLLTVNVIAFTYALATIFLSFFTLSKSDVSRNVLIAVFALDLILSYLLMSASTSAATGLRLIPLMFTGPPVDKFREKAAAAVAFSYLAFFVLAPAALLSGLRLARR